MRVTPCAVIFCEFWRASFWLQRIARSCKPGGFASSLRNTTGVKNLLPKFTKFNGARCIEPSEIIVEQPNKQKGNITHANPWIRFLARFFDYSLFFLLLLSSRKFFHGQLPFGKYEHLVPFEFFVWIPIEALLLSTWGSTPGKFFLKTKLKQGKKHKLAYMTALKRGFSVWFRGLGLGIPVLNFFCLLIAYNKLKLLQITSWDRDDHIVVTHYPIGKWRIYVAAFIAAAGILYYYSEKNLELKHTTALRQLDRFDGPISCRANCS